VATKIYITPPGGAEQELVIYDKCTVIMSATDRAGSISISSNSKDDTFFDLFTVGSDIKIIQDGNVSRGWILNPPRNISGKCNNIQIQGLSYAAKTQKILVAEVYTNQKISDIVKDLFTKYAPVYNLDSIAICDKLISIKFADVFLFDAMEQLATLAGYEWFINEPVPELIDTLPLPQGWQEIVDTFIYPVSFPSETLFPSDSLLPC
jgi:hypothetical protein